MVSEDDIVKFATGLGEVDQKTEKDLRVFLRSERIFLVIAADTNPLRIETRCDRKLGKTLQERYESVMESRALGRNGIEIICSGQLTGEEVLDLVRHAWEISAE